MRGLTKRLRVPWFQPKRTTSQSHLGEEAAEVNAQEVNPNGLHSPKTLPQPQWTRFEDANSWEAEEHIVMYCMNGQDNVPARMKLENDFVYYISQSRSPGHKDQGQDCMATAVQGNWEVHLLCDGHDKAGHMVALGICQQLPKILLRRITERNNDKENPCGANDPVSDRLVNEAFDECARVVCWTRDGISVGIWVKVFEGQWTDKPGYIKESNGQGKVRVAIIDENGYHLPSIDRSSLRRPRYTGGCTCLCLIRNTKTKECKIAVSGDSRILIMPTMGVNDAVLLRQFGVEETEPETPEKTPPQGLITPAHNVYNEEEKERLERDFHGQYEFDGNFLVNPITKFAIQPTRGFGDFDMFGTGYTHRPEITKTFKMEANGLIFAASDGVFDTHVWADAEIVSCLDKYIEEGLTSAQIVEHMYRETLQRSLEGGYVDDISIYCFKESAVPEVEEKVKILSAKPLSEEKRGDNETESMDLPTPKKVKKKRNTKEQRRTIGRGENSYTNLSAKVLELKEKMLKEEPEAMATVTDEPKEASQADLEKIGDILADGSGDDILDGVGDVMKKLAQSHRLGDDINPKELLTRKSMTEEEEEELLNQPHQEEEPAAQAQEEQPEQTNEDATEEAHTGQADDSSEDENPPNV